MTRVTFSSYEFDITDAIPKDKSKIVTFSNQRRNGRLTKIILQQTTVTLLLDVKMSTHQITIRDKWEKPKTVEEAFAAVKPRRRVGTVVRSSFTFRSNIQVFLNLQSVARKMTGLPQEQARKGRGDNADGSC